ncbi:hypothetical protein G5I_06739 [Acromyrmex echinatior]|uniref:Uncharacterized protein n=1 Tax=Acromyrmex echinatior TaxID=103372 RepID=F4WLV8_ACREC|nr:hypothetical protein G5I_06739 [Acromyrmex echinatior]
MGQEGQERRGEKSMALLMQAIIFHYIASSSRETISLKALRNLRGSRSPLAGWVVDKLAGRPTGRLVGSRSPLAGWLDGYTYTLSHRCQQAGSTVLLSNQTARLPFANRLGCAGDHALDGEGGGTKG